MEPAELWGSRQSQASFQDGLGQMLFKGSDGKWHKSASYSVFGS